MKTEDIKKYHEEINLPTALRLEVMEAHALRLESELERLVEWKASALKTIESWDKVWEAAGKPGRIGQYKSGAVRDFIQTILK
jgi:hypothetical protein